MVKIITIIAQFNGEYREVFNIQTGSDGSIYLKGSSEPNPHISIHRSGAFQVTYPFRKDGKKVHIAIEGGQPLASFKGCECPSEHVIEKSQFTILKIRDIATIKGETFVIDLQQFKTPFVSVATFIYDPTRRDKFERQVMQCPNYIKKTIDITIPNISLVAYEHPFK